MELKGKGWLEGAYDKGMIGRNSPGVQNGAWERKKRLLSDLGSCHYDSIDSFLKLWSGEPVSREE